MEGSNVRDLIDEEFFMKTSEVAGIGLVAGSVWGGLVWSLCCMMDLRLAVMSSIPSWVRTGKVCGNYAASFAVLGATYVGIKQALERYRMKKDFINGAVAGFAAGATVMGFRARRIPTAILSGSALALTSVLLDVTGMRTTEEAEKGHH